MPNFRCFPSGLGIILSLTGCGKYVPEASLFHTTYRFFSSSRSKSSQLSLSIPAALPPCRATAYASSTYLKLTGTVFPAFTFISNHSLSDCFSPCKSAITKYLRSGNFRYLLHYYEPVRLPQVLRKFAFPSGLFRMYSTRMLLIVC